MEQRDAEVLLTDALINFKCNSNNTEYITVFVKSELSSTLR